VLREAGLVADEVRAQRRVYRLERAPLALLDTWLDRFRPLPGRDDTAAGTTADTVLPGPAGRLDALDTEIRRGRRRATPTPTQGDDRDDRSAG
jgi:hypothetical protein